MCFSINSVARFCSRPHNGCHLGVVMWHLQCDMKIAHGGFPGGTVVESLPANAGDTGSSPGLGRSHMPRSN